MRYLIRTVLVVGVGSIGKRHIKIIKDLFPDINIVALRHSKCNKADIDKLGLYDCITSIDKAIATSPQVAIITNPATMHLEVAKKLANNGVNLLIEKPISNSSKGVRELIDICNKNNCILMTAYNLRFLPSLIEFKKQIELKKIGNIYSVRVEVGQYLPDWRPGCDYKRTVSAQKKLGGGVLLELSHEVDYLMWIFGSIKWVKAHVSKQSNLEIDVEDTANVLLGFESIKGYELTASLNMDFIRHDTKRQCIVIGEKGSLAWNGITGEVSFFGKGSDNWEVLNLSKPERNYTYAEEIKSFFSSIELQVAPCISGEDGLSVVTIIEAIKESNDRDAIVYL